MESVAVSGVTVLKGLLGFVAGVVVAALVVRGLYLRHPAPDMSDASSVLVPLLIFAPWIGGFLIAALVFGAAGAFLAIRYL